MSTEDSGKQPDGAARPAVDRFSETLLAPSMIRLFGRLFDGLQLTPAALASAQTTASARNGLTDKLDPALDPRLARIYGFSFEGNYYKLSAPAVFLVHGDGASLPAGEGEVSIGHLGVEFKDQTFASSVRVWAYDKLDMTIRIEIASGWLDDLLLGRELDAAGVTGGEMAGRESALVGRDSALVGRDSAMAGRSSALVGRARR